MINFIKIGILFEWQGLAKYCKIYERHGNTDDPDHRK